jgi:hypothetical protein
MRKLQYQYHAGTNMRVINCHQTHYMDFTLTFTASVEACFPASVLAKVSNLDKTYMRTGLLTVFEKSASVINFFPLLCGTCFGGFAVPRFRIR